MIILQPVRKIVKEQHMLVGRPCRRLCTQKHPEVNAARLYLLLALFCSCRQLLLISLPVRLTTCSSICCVSSGVPFNWPSCQHVTCDGMHPLVAA